MSYVIIYTSIYTAVHAPYTLHHRDILLVWAPIQLYPYYIIYIIYHIHKRATAIVTADVDDIWQAARWSAQMTFSHGRRYYIYTRRHYVFAVL